MCRYSWSKYKEHYACFNCRKAFKHDKGIHPCPECNQPMNEMGLDFKAPKQANKKAWKLIAILFEEGINFKSCGCGPGYRPRLMRALPDFLKKLQDSYFLKQENEGEKLLYLYRDKSR